MAKWNVGDKVPLHIVGVVTSVSKDGSRIGVDWPEPLTGTTVHVAKGPPTGAARAALPALPAADPGERAANVCGAHCEHGSECLLLTGHVPADRHETRHGCVFFDAARVESGPIQFGDDWPGLFLRGDEALAFGHALHQHLTKVLRPGAEAAIEREALRGLVEVLLSCEQGAKEPRKFAHPRTPAVEPSEREAQCTVGTAALAATCPDGVLVALADSWRRDAVGLRREVATHEPLRQSNESKLARADVLDVCAGSLARVLGEWAASPTAPPAPLAVVQGDVIFDARDNGEADDLARTVGIRKARS